MPTSMSETVRVRFSAARPWLFAALAVSAAFRATVLVRFGALMQPDSDDYVSFAKMILAGSDWFFSGSVESVMAFRMIGYPLLVAAAKLVADDGFDILIVVLQSILSLVAMVQLHRVGRGLSLPDWAAAFAALAYGCGISVVFDLNILTDGLFASLAVIAVCRVASAILERRPDRPSSILASGGLLTACVLLRDATLFASPVFALGAFCWGYLPERSWARGLRAVMIFLLPVAVVAIVLVEWNHGRTGYAFITTGSQHALLMPPVMLEEQGIPVLRDPVLREAYDATMQFKSPDFFPHVLEMGRLLQREKGLDAIARGRLAAGAYLTAWREAPLAMARRAVREYRGNQFLLLVSATQAWRDLKGLANAEINPGYRAVFADLMADPRGNFSALAVELAGLALSGLVFAGFVIGGAVACWRIVRGARDPETIVLVWFLVLYVGFVGMYAMVHLEARYTIAFQGLALIGGTAVLYRLARRMLRPVPALPGS
jgi:hypothetical protein